MALSMRLCTYAAARFDQVRLLCMCIAKLHTPGKSSSQECVNVQKRKDNAARLLSLIAIALLLQCLIRSAKPSFDLHFEVPIGLGL
jgi:hypothetical protein